MNQNSGEVNNFVYQHVTVYHMISYRTTTIIVHLLFLWSNRFIGNMEPLASIIRLTLAVTAVLYLFVQTNSLASAFCALMVRLAFT